MNLTKTVLFSIALVACGDYQLPGPRNDMSSTDLNKPPINAEGCDTDAECEDNLCIPILPIKGGGVCGNLDSSICKRVLVIDVWARQLCTSKGLTVSICPKETVRCVRLDVPIEYRYPYQCCETTLFE